MKIKRIACLTLIGILTFSMPVLAEENRSIQAGETETFEESSSYEDEEVIVFCDEESITLEDFAAADDILITDMVLNVNISKMETIFPQTCVASVASAYNTLADPYEPNNTLETAYNYDLMPEMDNNLYNRGLKNANLHTVEDVDWYFTTLMAGNTYFLDLRNIGATPNFNISLFYLNDDDTFDYLTSIGDGRFTGRPEKYYYFKPSKSGKYYVCITGDGVNTSDMNYFFYIGGVERTFTHTGYVGSVLVRGDAYQTGKTFDLTKAVVPEGSIVLSMSFSNDFSGQVCSECQKRIIASDGKTYYSSSTGGTDILNISRYQYLDQVWAISARCTNNKHFTTFIPQITARYSCIMQPYPGNEVY